MLPTPMVRENLDRLIQASPKDGYASISTLLGRNHAYIYQFIKQGTPDRLHESDRRTLAKYFDVHDWELGGPFEIQHRLSRGFAEDYALSSETVMVPFLDIAASAGPGSMVEEELTTDSLPLDPQWLRRVIGVTQTSGLTAIRVDGDSMRPTLAPGDQLLVDCLQRQPVNRAIFVIRHQHAIHVKRLRETRKKRIWAAVCDNPEYEGWNLTAESDSEILGRVLWISRLV